MKKVLISISMIVLLVVMSCSTAFADTTEQPVIAPAEGESDVTHNGNVKVSGDEPMAVGAYAVETDASATVTGNVSLDTTNEGYASEGATAIETMGVDNKATATVGGSVTANGKEQVTGVEIKYSGNVTVGKDVTVTAPLAGGAGVFALDDTTLKIGGNLFVNSAASDGDGRAIGIMINNLGATVLADIGGDVLVKGDRDATMGLVIGSYSEGSAQATNTSVLIHGSLVSSGYGILDASGNGITEVLVGNELKAEEVGIMLTDEEEPTNLKLTVWKIQLNSRGNVAEYQSGSLDSLPLDGDYGPHDVNPTEVSYKAATDFEKSIMYIIKYEQPKKGGKISAVDANGNPLAKSFGFDVAHEGDKVFLKTALKKGYKLVAAYNGAGEKVALLKDASGNYYYVVPKGGGVYLSVKLQKKAVKKKKTTPAPVYYGSSTADVQGVKTGDSAQTNLWYLLLFASIICFGVVKIRVRREEA